MSHIEEDIEKLIIPKDLSLEGLYNCDYTVRYHDIERDLLEKLRMRQIQILEAEYALGKETGPIPYDKPKKKEFYYTNGDINSICNKIYKDEFLAVFYADNIEDDNINTQMRLLYMLLNSHSGFKSIITDMIEVLYKLGMTNTEEEFQELQRQSKPIIFSTMFSQPLFYITHQCIVQMIRIRDIHPDLISLLRHKSVDKFKEEEEEESNLKKQSEMDNKNQLDNIKEFAVEVQNVKLTTVEEQPVNIEQEAVAVIIEQNVKKPRVKKVLDQDKPKKPRVKKEKEIKETIETNQINI